MNTEFSATVSGASYSYAYDNIGNRTSAQEAAEEATTYSANALNQYTVIDDFTPTYDADGNQTLVKTSTGIWTVAYNAENRPITFTNNESNTVVECAYDSKGRRATKQVTENGNVTLHERYIYRGYLQIACCDQTRTNHPCLWLITWDPTQPVATRPLAIQKSGTWYCYGWDLTKNICELFNSNGYINTIYTYTPYGKVTSSGSVTQPIQWSSEYRDTELSLVYYNYRHYNCADGKWLSRDMLGEFSEVNGYEFVQNNPCRHNDYTGLFIDTIWDVGNMVWDAGTIVAGALTGNSAMMKEGATDLLLDTAAAVIPGVPAGASKAARAAKRAAKQAEKEAARRAKKVSECLAIYASYHATGDQAGKCAECSSCVDFVNKLSARALEIKLRQKYLTRGCDHYLPGSLQKGTLKAIREHKGEIMKKRRAFSNCFTMAVKRGCTNLSDIAW